MTEKNQKSSHRILLQENRNLFNIGRNLKRIDYSFDLISGKVNEVFYQRDSIDQFLHKYEYDADNRITDVLTSRDGLIWDHDGRYKYYKHGPLARLEIGEQQVQGVDYAYTLQGWLKGINSSSRDSSRDMGRDAVPVSGQAGVFAKDAYAMTLGYFHDDFKPIGGNEFEADYNGKPFGNDSYHNSNTGYDDLGLYNGNIRHSVVSLGKMNYQHIGYVYRYDQLNRYTAMDAYNDFDNANNRWGTISSISEYKENVAYDPNGNVTYYKRNGSGGSPFTNNMDILNYAYVPNTNKLKHVQDAVDASYYANDIDNQTRYGVNYLYDATGNMVTDSAEHLHIYWNNYGKLDSTFNWNSGVAMKFIYDPSSNRIEKRFYSVPGNYSKRTNTYYIRDAQGNILANYVFKNDDTLSLTELDIYGSSRLGVLNADTILYDSPNGCNGCKSFVPSPLATYWLGKKQYELTNHLGNVLTTITD